MLKPAGRGKSATVLIAAAALGGLGLWLAASRLGGPGGMRGGQPYTYDMGDVQAIDPALVHWREADTLPLPLFEPTGLAVAPDGSLYVAGDMKLLQLKPDGDPIRALALSAEPTCVAVASDGAVVIGMRDHLEWLAAGASAPSPWASLGTNSTLVTSVTITDDGVFAADAGQRQVVRYDPAGNVLGRIGGDRDAGTTFIVPSPSFDVATGSGGELWVVDPGRHALKQFRATGELVSEWAKTSMGVDGFCGCCNPSHIAIAGDGSFVTSEKGIVRVKVHGPTGALRSVVAGPDAFEAGTVGLDLAIDAEGQVLVLDPKRRQVRIFRKKEP